MAWINKLLSRTDNIFNIGVYYTIIDLTDLPRDIIMTVATKLQNILSQMMHLHHQDSIMLQLKPHHKRSQYILKQHQLFNMKESKESHDFNHDNDKLRRSRSRCLLRIRGYVLCLILF